MAAGALVLAGVTRRFGTRPSGAHAAVDDVSLEVAPGELLALIGASGSGKTTTLRIVAGYEAPDAGRVLLDGADITAVPPEKRGFGMVFQHYALFPHLSVGENVGFGLEARGVRRDERRRRACEALETVGLGWAEERPVQSLSGGEQQRVALARALVIEPRVLLLDEPLSNLDPTLRRAMRNELRTMLRRVQVTALFVTHDQEDAFAIADRVALIERGRLLQTGTPEVVYRRPASASVASFVGRGTLLPATLGSGQVVIRVGAVSQSAIAEGTAPGAVLAVLRPESLTLDAPDTGGDDRGWPGLVASRRFAGNHWVYRVALADGPEVEVAGSNGGRGEGDRVAVSVLAREIAVVPA